METKRNETGLSILISNEELEAIRSVLACFGLGLFTVWVIRSLIGAQ